jgi:hypothetical protein
VIADLSADDPDLLPYLEYVREPARGYFSTTVPLDDGVELSTREGDAPPVFASSGAVEQLLAVKPTQQ